MTKTRQQRYKKRLLELQGRVRNDIGRLISAVVEEQCPPGEHERALVPSEEIEKEVALENTEESIHLAVAAALERMENGTFGCCQRCGAGIERERLDLLPYAAYCVRCAQETPEPAIGL